MAKTFEVDILWNNSNVNKTKSSDSKKLTLTLMNELSYKLFNQTFQKITVLIEKDLQISRTVWFYLHENTSFSFLWKNVIE